MNVHKIATGMRGACGKHFAEVRTRRGEEAVMRQVLTISIIIGSAFFGYSLLKDKITFAPNVGTPQTFNQSPINSQTSQPIAKSIRVGGKRLPVKRPVHTAQLNHRKDKPHEGRSSHVTNSNSQGTRYGEDERASDAAEEIEKLSSIYQSEERREQRESEPELADSDDTFQAAEASSPIPGVKTAAWIRSRQNHINTEVPDPKVGQGVRVFLNCLELKKKGASPLVGSECDAVLAKKEAVPKSQY